MTGLLYLVPCKCVQLDEESDIPEELTKAVKSFEGDLPHSVMLDRVQLLGERMEGMFNISTRLID